MKFLQKLNIHQTRSQILFGFILVMVFTLILTFSISYYTLYSVQKEKTTNYINEIAKQASGHLESLLNEINVITLQTAMDESIQDILSDELHYNLASYDDIMQIRKQLYERIGYSDTIKDIEIYSNERALYPITDSTITERIGPKNENIASRSSNAGSLLWLGLDPENSKYILAVRQILIEKDQYKKGGYLVIRVKHSLIDFINNDVPNIEGSVMHLFDKENQLISTRNNLNSLSISKNDYITINKNINTTDWTLSIFLPKKVINKETHFLQIVIFSAAIFSIVLFALMSYYLSSLITSPIKNLTKVIRKGSSGNLQINNVTYFNYEINQLNKMYNQMVEKINHLIESVYEKEILKSKSEIKALHSQINPHFLFNTLDMIYWDLVRKNEKKLSKVVLNLAYFFRYTINSKSDDGFITIQKELEQVKRYTDIIKMRFQNRFNITISIPENIIQVKIPKLILQPIIENAIKYGIEEMEYGGEITLKAYTDDHKITFIVQDNGVGIEQDILKEINKNLYNRKNRLISSGTGIGIYNIHKLIQLHYGKKYGLAIESKVDEGTTVIITIPNGGIEK